MNDLFLQEDSIKNGVIYEIMCGQCRWLGQKFMGFTSFECWVLVLEGCDEYFKCLTPEGICELHITSFKMTNEITKKKR